MKVCFTESDSLGSAIFALCALLIAGISGCVAGAALFKWAPEQSPPRSAKWWALIALAAWLSVGAYAEIYRGAPKSQFEFRLPSNK
jgi:hypothetical protein